MVNGSAKQPNFRRIYNAMLIRHAPTPPFLFCLLLKSHQLVAPQEGSPVIFRTHRARHGFARDLRLIKTSKTASPSRLPLALGWLALCETVRAAKL